MNIFASKFLFDLIHESLTSGDRADKVEKLNADYAN